MFASALINFFHEDIVMLIWNECYEDEIDKRAEKEISKDWEIIERATLSSNIIMTEWSRDDEQNCIKR